MLSTMVASAIERIVICLVAAVALAGTAALARAHGRRLERRMAAELGRRWGESGPSRPDPSPEAVGTSPSEGSEDPDAELRITLDELLERRDALLEEFQAVQSEIQSVKREVERRRPVIPAILPDDDEIGPSEAEVIVLRNLAPDEERSQPGR